MLKDYKWMMDARNEMFQNKLIVEMVMELFSVSNKMTTKDFADILESAERNMV